MSSHGKSYFLDALLKNAGHENQIGSYDSIKIVGTHDDSTIQQFGALQNAYNYFKESLFHNSLTPVILTLNRKAHSSGYFKPCAWHNEAKHQLPEINISPAILAEPTIAVMQTLVHEMAHHFHYIYGKPGSRGYHNREFSQIMFALGLATSSTGRPGGKKTGHRMSDYVIPGGRFEQAFSEIPEDCILPFYSSETVRFIVTPTNEIKKAEKNKVKYSCPTCANSVWGKPKLQLICGDCKNFYNPQNLRP